MRKLLLACCLTALAASPAIANKMDKDPSEKAEFLQKVLQLDDQQAQQVRQILEQSSQQGDQLKSKYNISQYDEYRDEKKSLMSDTRDKIADVLEPKQQEALDALHEHKQEKKGAMKKMMDKVKN